MNIIEKINKIDELFTRSMPENQQEMLECLDEPVAKSYFIRKLAGKFDPQWFEFAYIKKILSFSDIPEAVRSQDADGKETLGFKNWEGAFPIVKAAEVISNYPNLSSLIVRIINDYIDLTKKNQTDDARNFTVDYHISKAILLLPFDLLDTNQLQFVFNFGLRRDRSLLSRELVSSFFPRTLDGDKDLAMLLLDRFYTPIFEKRLHRAHSIVDDYALENFSKTAPEMLYRHLGDAVVYWSIDKLVKVSGANGLMFSKVELTSLEPDPQNLNETGLNFSLVNLVIGLLSLMPLDELETQLKKIINLDEQIISRIAYYIIDRNYKSFSHLFFQLDNPLNRFEAKLEIYRLIKRNCENFTEEEVSIITGWIERLEVDKIDNESQESQNQYHTYRQLEWYLALEPIHYKYQQLVEQFNKLKVITEGSLPSHPGYDSYFSTSSGGDYSSTNRIIGRSVVDVLNILANNESWDGYNIYGLQQDLREYVNTSYSDVVENLNKFQALPIPFIYHFVDGFRGMAEKGAQLDIARLLDFFRLFVDSRPDLWDPSKETRDKSGSIGMIAWTIKTLVGNNNYVLTIQDIEKAVESLIIMESKFIGTFEWLNEDPVNDIINSARGHIYDAMISCSIKEVKIRGEAPFWNEKVKDVFTKRLATKSASVEFYWSLGFNIPQISYLDIQWLRDFHRLLVEEQEGKYQLPVFYGYLLFSGQLYTNLYELLYPTYLTQIDVQIKNSTIVRRLVEHIWIAFAIELANANTLIDRVIESADLQKLTFLIDRIKIEEFLKGQDKIRYAWKRILPIARQSTNMQLKEKAFEMVYFAELLQDFNLEDLEIFKRTISLGKTDVNTYRLLKIVEAKLHVKDFEMAGQLFEVLLEKLSEDAYFDESKVIGILEVLYKNGKQQHADNIAIAAVERKNFSVVSIYNKYH